MLSLELHSIAFSLDYWWFSGELRHKHSIQNELLLLSLNLPWSKIICFPAGLQLHLFIIFHLLLKLWDIFLFQLNHILFPFVACVLAFWEEQLFNLQDLKVKENLFFLWPSRFCVPLSFQSAGPLKLLTQGIILIFIHLIRLLTGNQNFSPLYISINYTIKSSKFFLCS